MVKFSCFKKSKWQRARTELEQIPSFKSVFFFTFPLFLHVLWMWPWNHQRFQEPAQHYFLKISRWIIQDHVSTCVFPCTIQPSPCQGDPLIGVSKHCLCQHKWDGPAPSINVSWIHSDTRNGMKRMERMDSEVKLDELVSVRMGILPELSQTFEFRKSWWLIWCFCFQNKSWISFSGFCIQMSRVKSFLIYRIEHVCLGLSADVPLHCFGSSIWAPRSNCPNMRVFFEVLDKSFQHKHNQTTNHSKKQESLHFVCHGSKVTGSLWIH